MLSLLSLFCSSCFVFLIHYVYILTKERGIGWGEPGPEAREGVGGVSTVVFSVGDFVYTCEEM